MKIRFRDEFLAITGIGAGTLSFILLYGGERGSVLDIVFSTQNAANRRKTGKMSGMVYARGRI